MKVFLVIGFLVGLMQSARQPAAFSCKREKDALTGMMVYTEADAMPESEGGASARMRKLNKVLVPDSLYEDIDPRIIVAFIVDVDGSIKGERVLNDKTGAGRKILTAVKELKWKPDVCNNKKVPVLYKISILVCSDEE